MHSSLRLYSFSPMIAVLGLSDDCRPSPPAPALTEVTSVSVRAEHYDYEGAERIQLRSISMRSGDDLRTSAGDCLELAGVTVSLNGEALSFTERGGTFYDPLCGGDGGGCWACREPRATLPWSTPGADGLLTLRDGALTKRARIEGLVRDRGIHAPATFYARNGDTIRFPFDARDLMPEPFVQAVLSGPGSTRVALEDDAIAVTVFDVPPGRAPLYVSIDYALVVESTDVDARAGGSSIWSRAIQVD